MSNHVYKSIELTGSSPKSMEDAIQHAIALACPLHTSHVTEPLHMGQTKARCAR